MVPSDVFMDDVTRLALTVQCDGDRARGMAMIDVDTAAVDSQAIELVQDFMPPWVIANGADHVRLGAQRLGVIRKIRGRSAKLLAAGQQVPEDFTDANYDRPFFSLHYDSPVIAWLHRSMNTFMLLSPC